MNQVEHRDTVVYRDSRILRETDGDSYTEEVKTVCLTSARRREDKRLITTQLHCYTQITQSSTQIYAATHRQHSHRHRHTQLCIDNQGQNDTGIGLLGTGQYSQILGSIVIGGYFCCSDTQYNTNQRAVSTVHMPVNDYLVPLLTCTLTDTIVCLDTMLICCCLLNTIIVVNIEFGDFSWSLLCSTQVSVLVLGIGIARGQYYWVLDIGCLSWYRSNPIDNTITDIDIHAPTHR